MKIKFEAKFKTKKVLSFTDLAPGEVFIFADDPTIIYLTLLAPANGYVDLKTGEWIDPESKDYWREVKKVMGTFTVEGYEN